MKRITVDLRILLSVIVVTLCTDALAGGGKTPEEAFKTYFKSILAKDADGALSVVYVPDKLPNWFAKDVSRFNSKRIEAMARENIENIIDQMSQANVAVAATNIPWNNVETCITNRYAILIAKPEKERLTDFQYFFMVRMKDGWKLPFEIGAGYVPLLPEDRKGEKEFEWLKEWAEKTIADFKNKATQK